MDTSFKQYEKAIKYINLCKYNASIFSEDNITHVGCIMLSENFASIISTGVNKSPRYEDAIVRKYDPLNVLCHAASNCIANALKNNASIKGCLFVTTKFPCSSCATKLVEVGIAKMYSLKPTNNIEKLKDFELSKSILNQTSIDVILFNDSNLIVI